METFGVRRAVLGDVSALMELAAALVEDGRGEVRGPDDLRTLAAHEDAIGRRTPWVAIDGGRVVGQARLSVLRPLRCRHVATLDVGIHPSFQRRGHGRRLMNVLLNEAHDKQVHRLELYVRADNHRALAMYRSLGFELESVRKDFIRLDDGTFADDLCMVRFRPGVE